MYSAPSNRSPLRLVRIFLITLFVTGLIAAVPWNLPVRTSQASTAVVFSKDDLTQQVPRGTADTIIHYAQARGSVRLADTVAYINEVYRLAPLVGIDPAFVIAQSALETADWTSYYWETYLNPAGIGIGWSGAPSYTWATGTDAARYHLVHLYVYINGVPAIGNPLYPYRTMGPGYSGAVALGYAGTGKHIDDFTGRWATDPLYGTKIANRGNSIYAKSVAEVTAPGLPVASVDASGGNDPFRTRDWNLQTSFAVSGIGTPPAGAWITYDLGRRVNLERIRWLFRLTGYADAYSIQTSNNATTWATVASYGNSASNAWVTLDTIRSARYIRFLFTNPNGDLTIGYLSEVEFYGVNATGTATPTSTPYPTPTFTPTPTATPTPTPAPMPGTVLPILGGGGSSTGTWSGNIRDGSTTTTWQTTTTPAPNSAAVYVDLGASYPLTGVQYFFRRNSGAKSFEVRISSDLKTWTTVATGSNPQTMIWQPVLFNQTGRYVQFLFRNTNGAVALGYLAEIRVYGSTSPAPADDTTSTPTATMSATATSTLTTSDTSTPTPTAPDTVDPLPTAAASPVAATQPAIVTGISRTANSSPATALLDDDPATTWSSLDGNSATVQFDLSTVTTGVPVTILLATGSADDLSIATSADGSSWTTAAGPLTEIVPGEFQVILTDPVSSIRITVAAGVTVADVRFTP